MSIKITIAALCACAAALLAAPAGAKPCTQADLAGVWSLTTVSAAQPEVSAYYAANPVEYVRFSVDGNYAVLNGRERLADAPAVNARLDAAIAAGTGSRTAMGIVMNDPGELILMDGGEAFEGYMCAVDGDTLVWTQTDGSPAVRKVLARVR